MKAEYDFSKAKRSHVMPPTGRTQVTLYLDDHILEQFGSRADAAGTGFHNLINYALQEYLSKDPDKLEQTLRKIIREEIGR